MTRAPLLLLAVLAAPAAVSAAPCAPAPGAICAGGEALDEAGLLALLKGADIAILGERHDNPRHHEWQARLTEALAPGGLAFEMIPQEKEDAANNARDLGEDLGEALDWANSGWPDWAMYAPIFEAAPEAWIAGGGVPREALMRSAQEGAAKAGGEALARYRLDERMPEDVAKDMIREQDEAHCGALPTAILPGMVEAQQLRDAAFADAALRLHEAGHRPVVFITGNGHARTDRGSPLYLRRAAPEVTVVSVGLIEIPEGADPAALEGGAPFDAVIYTEPFDRGDPCEAFLKSRGKD
ncbi:MAG: ChaN family lipoprotein [Pikeienuella sp.]|uniref:ChaN family lipoprotein n=1 Tax=Pikeienuella sp. TaxID=2831957 RepID=UPI003919E2DD